jgi:hypothetical protein
MEHDHPEPEGMLPDLLYTSPQNRLTEQSPLEASSSNSPSSPSTSHVSSQHIDALILPWLQPSAVVAKIEDILEAIADCLLHREKQLTIQLKIRPKKLQSSGNGDMLEESVGPSFKTIRFPSKSVAECRRFSKSGTTTSYDVGIVLTCFSGSTARAHCST